MGEIKLRNLIWLMGILVIFGTMISCSSESKLVGTYVSESVENDGFFSVKIKQVLELKSDNTFKYELYVENVQPQSATGEWRLIKGNGEEAINFMPLTGGLVMNFILEKSKDKGYYFYDPIYRTALVKVKK